MDKLQAFEKIRTKFEEAMNFDKKGNMHIKNFHIVIDQREKETTKEAPRPTITNDTEPQYFEIQIKDFIIIAK